MNLFIPDMYAKNVYEINYNKLKENNIKYLFFDLDNTLISYKDKLPSKDNINLFKKLNKQGFTCILFSNSHSNRLFNYKDKIGVDVYYSSMKPLKKNYRKILKKYKKEECAFIGDQLMTDVLGAKRNKLFVIFVDKILDDEPIYTRFWRFFERIVIKKLNKKNILVKGKYYD